MRYRERNRRKHAHMCAVYGNEIDVKGDQGGKKKRLAKRWAKCTREHGPFDGPNEQLYPLTQTVLQQLSTFLSPSFSFLHLFFSFSFLQSHRLIASRRLLPL